MIKSRIGRAYGEGIYCTQRALRALETVSGTNTLLVCAALPKRRGQFAALEHSVGDVFSFSRTNHKSFRYFYSTCNTFGTPVRTIRGTTIRRRLSCVERKPRDEPTNRFRGDISEGFLIKSMTRQEEKCLRSKTGGLGESWTSDQLEDMLLFAFVTNLIGMFQCLTLFTSFTEDQ